MSNNIQFNKKNILCFFSGFSIPIIIFIILYSTNIIHLINNNNQPNLLQNNTIYNSELNNSLLTTVSPPSKSKYSLRQPPPPPPPKKNQQTGSSHLPSLPIHSYDSNPPWKCIPNNVLSPVRINSNDNAECLSFNGKNCTVVHNLYDCVLLAKTNFTNIIPLECGNKHMEIYGINGYLDHNHWCYITSVYYY